MTALARDDAKRVTAICAELDTLHLGAAGGVVDAVLPEVRALLDVDIAALYSVNLTEDGCQLDRWHHVGLPRRFGEQFAKMLAATGQLLFYDLARPLLAQRNRVIEAMQWIDRDVAGTWEQSRLCREVMKPMGLHAHKQPRVLICDGPSLLAWFGAIHPEPFSRRQTRLLGALVPAMQRRLSTERRLATSRLTAAAFHVALEQLGAPAFIVNARGAIAAMNAAGRTLVDERGAELACALQSTVRGESARIDIELVAIRDHGVAPHWLAVVRADSIEARITACVAAAARRWTLTARQTAVLNLIARGMANATIAATLGVGDRAVELHVTALFDRAGVDSRAALVARTLIASP